MASLRPLVVGNWKMNGLRAALNELAAISDAVKAGRAGRADVVVCPPFTLLVPAADLCAGGPVQIGGQDCHATLSGSFTGDVSAEMVRDAGAAFVIVGHSERRSGHGETDAMVEAKAAAALRAGLLAIICVGETRAERDSGETLRVVGRQIDNSIPQKSLSREIVVAYEPVWAIGTGLVPSDADVSEVHGFIRRRLGVMLGPEGEKVRLLYGGSVKPANAKDLLSLPNVDGALVGGASLVAQDFVAIAETYR